MATDITSFMVMILYDFIAQVNTNKLNYTERLLPVSGHITSFKSYSSLLRDPEKMYYMPQIDMDQPMDLRAKKFIELFLPSNSPPLNPPAEYQEVLDAMHEEREILAWKKMYKLGKMSYRSVTTTTSTTFRTGKGIKTTTTAARMDDSDGDHEEKEHEENYNMNQATTSTKIRSATESIKSAIATEIHDHDEHVRNEINNMKSQVASNKDKLIASIMTAKRMDEGSGYKEAKRDEAQTSKQVPSKKRKSSMDEATSKIAEADDCYAEEMEKETIDRKHGARLKDMKEAAATMNVAMVDEADYFEEEEKHDQHGMRTPEADVERRIKEASEDAEDKTGENFVQNAYHGTIRTSTMAFVGFFAGSGITFTILHSRRTPLALPNS